MKLLTLLVLILVITPAMAELTDYQRGIQQGLLVGLKMGYLQGAAPFNTNAAQQYSSMLSAYNARLPVIFGNNLTYPDYILEVSSSEE